ncbi:MAG: hypothetical protein AVDCRST_MAG47-484, partial [uncultured Nocardioidaceae bacterium]
WQRSRPRGWQPSRPSSGRPRARTAPTSRTAVWSR